MTLSGLWTTKFSPTENKPSPSSAVSDGIWTRLKQRLSHRRDQEIAGPGISRDTEVSTKNTTRERTRNLALQTTLPQSSITFAGRPATLSPSEDNSLPPIQTEYARSSPQAAHDSQLSNLLSKCDLRSSAALRADNLGATPSTECHSPSLDVEANAGEVVKAAPSQHSPSVLSSDHVPVRFTERSEESPSRKSSFEVTLESLNALLQHENDELSACLSAGAFTKAQRLRLHAQTFRAQRSALELANQTFSLELNALGSDTSSENDGPAVDRESVKIAGREVESSSAAAPVAVTPPSHSNPYEWVIKAITPCIQSADGDHTGVTPLKHAEASSPSCHPRDSERPTDDVVNECHLLASTNNLGQTGSDEAIGQAIVGEWVRSAGSLEVISSLPDAPAPPSAALRFEPCGIVVLVTPPSPSTTIPPSPSQRYAKRREMTRNAHNSHLVSHLPQLAKSTSQPGHPRFSVRGFGDILAQPSSVKNYSRPFRTGTGQVVGCATYVCPSKRTTTQVTTNLIEREISSRTMHTKNEALAPSCLDAQRASTFRSSGEPLDRSPSLPKLGPSSSAGNDHQAADGEDDATHASAADEAEPSLVDAPIIPTPLLTRKPIRVKRLVEVPTPHTARQQVRLLRSRVTSSLSQWGNAVSRFVHRPAIPEGNGAINPYFDPWEGYVPPRGPSPDGIVPNDALETPKSSIWNIYVKLDE